MKKIFYSLIGALLLFSACNSNDDAEALDEQLTPEVAQHLKDYYEGAKIRTVHNWKNDTHPGTAVELSDKEGNEVSLFFRDFKELSLTVTKFSRFDNLPSSVRNGFLASPYGEMEKDRINKIECDDYAQLPNKMYRFEFTNFVPDFGALFTQLTFNADGYMLPENHSFVNQAWFHPCIDTDEIDFINNHYGADIRSYDNNGGFNDYHVVDHEVLKKVTFRDGWHSTVYSVPLDTEVPAGSLKKLYELEPDFKYVTLRREESPNGNGYLFLNEKGDGYFIKD